MFQYFWQKLLDQEGRGDAKSEQDDVVEVGNRKAFAFLRHKRQVADLFIAVWRISGPVDGLGINWLQ